MKCSKKLKAIIYATIVLVIAVAIYLLIVFETPNRLFVQKNARLVFNSQLVTVEKSGVSVKSNATPMIIEKYSAVVRLFGIFPVKTVDVVVTPELKLIPGGQAFGVKLFTKGVVVVGTKSFDTETGVKNPATDAGIRIKDIILAINGTEINTVEALDSIVKSSNGKSFIFLVQRNNLHFETTVMPVSTKNDGYKIGLWIRDSTAGIGTITFYDLNKGIFAGLGHPITDVDTGEILPLGSGSVVKAKIIGANIGTEESPGELNGVFTDEAIGDLKGNSESGIYGILTEETRNNQTALPVAYRQQVKVGPAQILTTVDNEGPKYYNINISKVYNNSYPTTKNMVIEIIDPVLLEKTGGIVQGMSGSPIIQNGCIVGAVTHVFVNDYTKGYGIFIEKMLENINDVSLAS